MVAFFTPFTFVKLNQFYSVTSSMCGIKEKKIICMCGWFSVLHYIEEVFAIEFLETHICINNPHQQSSAIPTFLGKYYIVISNTLIGSLLNVFCNFIRTSRETKKERLSYSKKVHRRICMRDITYLTARPPFYVIFPAFFVYFLPLPKYCTC